MHGKVINAVMMIVGKQHCLVVHRCTEEVPPRQQRQRRHVHINSSLTTHRRNVQPGKQGIRSRQKRTDFVMDPARRRIVPPTSPCVNQS